MTHQTPLPQVFSVFDSAAQRFLHPFTADTTEVAIRQFRHLVNQDGHQFNTFPEDYSLFHLGSFNPDTGHIVPNATPHSLGVGITFLSQPSKLPEPSINAYREAIAQAKES